MSRYRRAAAVVLVNLVVLATGVVLVELLFGAWLNPSNLRFEVRYGR